MSDAILRRLGRARSLLLPLLALALTGCEPLRLDPFLYDPLPAPAGGYDLSTAVIPRHEDLFIPTPDGETLHAVFIPSSGRRPDVTLLYFHGQSYNLGKSWGRLELLYPLGYNLVALDPRGYGLSTGTPSEPGIQLDLRTFHTVVTKRPGIDAAKLVYYGWSFGGAQAIELASAAAPAVLITEATFTSIADLVKDGAYVDLPRSFVADSAWDSLAKIRSIHSPYLLLHGTADRYVQFAYAGALLGAHPGRHRLEAVSGADHSDLPDRLGLDQYRALLRTFVEETLP